LLLFLAGRTNGMVGCWLAGLACCVDRSGRWLCVLWALSGLLCTDVRSRARARDTDAHTGRAPVRLSSYYMTGLGGLCPPQFGQVATGCRSIFVRWTTFAICAVWKRCSPTSVHRRLPRFPCLLPTTYNRGTHMRLMKLLLRQVPYSKWLQGTESQPCLSRSGLYQVAGWRISTV
jgi:hypothetical protein